jgi:protein gp37
MSTSIEWTDATWNPAVGCEHISPGCDNCYAAGVASRQMQPAHEGLTIGRKWNGDVRTLPDRLSEPRHWRKPRRVFVGSMTDLFHRDVPDRFLLGVWATMAEAPQHTFQILTKRPQRMSSFVADLPEWGQTLPNVWLGTSIESDRYAWRADHLRATPAAVRFLSLEPLLGPLPSLDLTGVDWVIVGGESGAGARPMHPDWVRDLRDRCLAECVACRDLNALGYAAPPIGCSRPAFFFKQWGSHDEHGTRMNKHKSGRMLDGRTWDGFPA